MHNVVINGKKFLSEDNAPLKEVLEKADFFFPCGGNGKCGKCRIVCKAIAPTELDKRFLTANAIEEGVRIACDKIIDRSMEIFCEIAEKRETVKLHDCSVAVSITDEDIDICIVGEEPVETITEKNPLSDFTAEALAEEYMKNPSAATNALRAVIGKESVELFERYGTAKASTLAVAGKGLYLKILAGLPLEAENEEAETKSETDVFGLPAESLYLLPTMGDFIGGEILAETILLKENSLLIDCEKTVVLYGIGKDDDLATAIWDCDYSEVAMRCITAATKLMLKDFAGATVYLCGRYADAVEDALNKAGLSVIQKEKSVNNVVSALLSFRTRSKLLKEKNRTTAIKIYDNEEFQNFLTE